MIIKQFHLHFINMVIRQILIRYLMKKHIVFGHLQKIIPIIIYLVVLEDICLFIHQMIKTDYV